MASASLYTSVRWHLASVSAPTIATPSPVGCDPALDPLQGKWQTLPSPPTAEQMADPAYVLALSLHAILPFLGLSIGELFDLDTLAEDCAARGGLVLHAHDGADAAPERGRHPGNAVAIR